MLRDLLLGVPRAIVDSFRGLNFLGHVLAIILTFALVLTGFDWWYFLNTRSEVLRPIIMIAGLGGFIVPIIVPAGLCIYGVLQKDLRALYAGIAVVQASAVAWLISVMYKALTGRIQPNGSDGLVDISHNFQFGFLEHGIFWGWPSSHTTVAFAASVTLFLLYRSRSLRVVAMLWAFLVAIGASVGFHWHSDVIAGAIIGTIVGMVVARHSENSVRNIDK